MRFLRITCIDNEEALPEDAKRLVFEAGIIPQKKAIGIIQTGAQQRVAKGIENETGAVALNASPAVKFFIAPTEPDARLAGEALVVPGPVLQALRAPAKLMAAPNATMRRDLFLMSFPFQCSR